MDNFDIVDLPISSDDGTVFGVCYVPHGAGARGPVPTVICAHGLNRSHVDMDRWARELARRGYLAYCPDFRGGNGDSDGDPLAMSLFTQQHDLEAVYHALSRRPEVDANNMFLMGHSVGATVAALACAALAKRIKGLILLSPTFNVGDLVRVDYPDASQLPQTCTFFGREVGRAFLEAALEVDFPVAQAAYQGPVLIIQGTDDDTALASYAMEAAKVYPHAQLELISGAGHHFEGGIFKYAVKCIVGLLDEEADLADESGLEGDLNFGGGMGGMGGMGMMR